MVGVNQRLRVQVRRKNLGGNYPPTIVMSVQYKIDYPRDIAPHIRSAQQWLEEMLKLLTQL